jgi:pilus assembly protein Flp/PilA
MKKLMRFLKDDDGVTMIEYGLIAGIISVALLVVLVATSGALNDIFTAIKNALTTAASS